VIQPLGRASRRGVAGLVPSSKDSGSPIIKANSDQARRSQFTTIRTTRDLFRRA